MVTLTAPDPAVNFPAPVARVMSDAEFSAWASTQVALELDECRPTAPAAFEPTPEEEAERLALEVVAEERRDEAEHDARLDRLHRDRMAEAFGSPEERWHPAELAECGSRSGHPAYEA